MSFPRGLNFQKSKSNRHRLEQTRGGMRSRSANGREEHRETTKLNKHPTALSLVSKLRNETMMSLFTSRRITEAVFSLIFLLLFAMTESDAFQMFGNSNIHVNMKQHRWVPFRCNKSTMILRGSSLSHQALRAMQRGIEEEDNAFTEANNHRFPTDVITLQPDDENDAMLKAVLDVAILASRRAAAIIVENSQGADVLETKSTSRDLLTRIDPMCEKTIQETVMTYFPNHLFLGEESVSESGIEASKAALEEKLEQGGWLWIVDPIDGTTNFASGIPINAPSVAVAYNGELMVGVIHDPHRNEEWTAIKGRGALLNEIPLVVSGSENMMIGDAVIGCESPAGQNSLETALKGIQTLMPKCRTIRILGSTAIKMPWVAQGRLTCYWSPDECAWDHAAGAIIAQEAGAILTDLDGSPFTLRTRKFLVSQNTNVHQQVLDVLKDAGIQ